ncbi:50S ribosomal protein L4 [archaeon]|nr:50S ribosomal protein L4 [archaeon]|tara:strand:+ start:734 stop:1537 length:804 start_codon:yes stop_codon:yes gene_type:complete
MKVDVLNLEGKKVKTIDLPKQFEEPVRLDLIKRAFYVIQDNKRQPYGANPEAGMRASAKISRRRHNYKTAYGYGISRVPRKILTKRGTRFSWVGAVAPGTVSGRKAHPPKAEKIWDKKINKKERRKAIRCALSATINKELIKSRGHLFKEAPLILDSKLESLSKIKEVSEVFKKINLEKELDRINVKKIRAGKGKNRGRKYKIKKGPLLVVSDSCALEKSAKNFLGVDICKVNKLNVELLAPGTEPGRLTIYTDKSLEKLSKENLFM